MSSYIEKLEFEHVVGKEDEILRRHFPYTEVGAIKVGPQKWMLTKPFLKYAERIKNFKLRSTDVIVQTFPKSGTTWMQELIWTLVNNPNLDSEEASKSITFRVPEIGIDSIIDSPYTRKLLNGFGENTPRIQTFKKLYPDKDWEDGTHLITAESLADPRILKTHLSLDFFDEKALDTCKVIYVTRNPKDIILSFHHHLKISKTFDFQGSLDDFIDHFINNRVLFCPFWEHIREAYRRKDHPNFLFLRYEDMQENMMEELKKIMEFLNVSFLTTTQMENVIQYCSFSEMKKRFGQTGGIILNGLNTDNASKEVGFFRKGIVGDWKNSYTPEQIRKLDEWIEKNSEGIDILN